MRSSYSIAQVARECGVSYRTIKRRVDEGLIPAKRYGPKTTRIDRTTLIRLKQEGLNGLASAQMALL
jgi:excisionase family DNA binding protein